MRRIAEAVGPTSATDESDKKSAGHASTDPQPADSSDGFGDSATLQEIGRRQFLFTEGFRAPDWTGLADDQWVYYVLLVFAFPVFWLVRNLIKSRPGRAIIAVRMTAS